nr:ABC transporter permease [Oceanococcus sp. HetDA_MAG_MS8]
MSAWLLQDPLLPGPAQVLQVLLRETLHGELLFHLGATLARVGSAFVLAMGLGCALGMAMGRSARLNAALDGLLVLSLNLPALVTMILCYVWFGLSDLAAILAVALNKIPTVVVTLREGTRALDRKLLEVAAVYQLPPLRRLGRVVLPQLVPYMLVAARSGLALIWKIVLVVELMGRPNGVGFQLSSYFHYFDIAGVLAYTLAFALVVISLEALILRPAERRFNRWRP